MQVALVVTAKRSKWMTRILFQLSEAEKFLICPPQDLEKVIKPEFMEREKMNFSEIYIDQGVDSEITKRIMNFGEENSAKIFLVSIKILKEGESKIAPGTTIFFYSFFN